MCQFHDPSIIGSRDTRGGGGGSEGPHLPSPHLPRKLFQTNASNHVTVSNWENAFYDGITRHLFAVAFY